MRKVDHFVVVAVGLLPFVAAACIEIRLSNSMNQIHGVLLQFAAAAAAADLTYHL